MNTPPISSPDEWQAAREELLVKEKELPPYKWWNHHDAYGESA